MPAHVQKQGAPSRSFLARNWWVILFFALSYLLYSHSMHKKKETLRELQVRFKEIEEEKLALLDQQNALRMQVRSQSDPAWVEMTLIKALGLVPEGERKVYFETQD